MEPEFRVIRIDSVFNGPRMEWDIHPTQERLIVVRSVGSEGGEEDDGQDRFIVVTNWFEELRRRAGN